MKIDSDNASWWSFRTLKKYYIVWFLQRCHIFLWKHGNFVCFYSVYKQTC